MGTRLEWRAVQRQEGARWVPEEGNCRQKGLGVLVSPEWRE